MTWGKQHSRSIFGSEMAVFVATSFSSPIGSQIGLWCRSATTSTCHKLGFRSLICRGFRPSSVA